MPSEFTNVLPEERQARLQREYWLRLSTVAALVFSLLVCVAGMLLIPAYLYLTATEHLKEAQLTALTTKLSSAHEAALSSRLIVLSNNAEALASLAQSPVASAILRDALATLRPGIRLSGIKYTAAQGKTPGVLALSGVAGTRDALRSYQIALEKAPFARSAELPVSVYAKDANIPFTITLSLRP